MNRKRIIFLILIFLSFQGKSQSLDDIIKNHLQSWGQDQLLEIRTFQFDITEVKGIFERSKYQVIRKRPNKVRIDEIYDNKPVVTCFDGTGYWGVVPWHVSEGKYQLTSTEKEKLKNAYTADSPLYLAQLDSLSMTYLGEELSDELPYHVIRISTNHNRFLDYYIDTNSFEILKTVERDQGNPKYIFTETFFKNYRSQLGMNLPTEYEIRGRENTRHTILQNLTMGHGIPDSYFTNMSQ